MLRDLEEAQKWDLAPEPASPQARARKKKGLKYSLPPMD